MAKTVTQAPADDWGFTGRPETRKVTRVKTTEIPWTRGPQTRWQRIKRAAVG